MPNTSRSPAELRDMFGANLRRMSAHYPSISELSRRLGINRTQFNRYLSGESFPRPDVLARICDFFKVDARILLEPVESLADKDRVLTGSVLAEFAASGAVELPEDLFPSGFYRFTRRSFISKSQFILGLIYVFHEGGHTYVRGYEAREAMVQQGLPTDPRTREFRGFAMRQDDGVALIVCRRNAMTCSFNYLSRVASFENNFWVGYVTRTMPESATGTRVERLVYEYIDHNTHDILATARNSGFISEGDLQPFHRRLLQPDQPFR
jgi:transcriptional regulator with XRE-family HTH domain